MRHQGPTQTVGQRRLPRCQRDRRHIKGVCLTSFPRQELLQSLKTTADWFSGVGIVVFGWKAQEMKYHMRWWWCGLISRDQLRLLQAVSQGNYRWLKSDTEPGRGEGIYLMTSWIPPESIGWSKQDSSLMIGQGGKVRLIWVLIGVWKQFYNVFCGSGGGLSSLRKK